MKRHNNSISGEKTNKIPSSWKIMLLTECAEINPESLSSNTAPNYKFNYIDISSIETTGTISKLQKLMFKDAPSRARRIVHKGDIILSTVRPYLKAFVLVQNEIPDLICSTDFAVLRTKPIVFNSFLFQYICSDIFVNYLMRVMVGSNYPAVNTDDLKLAKIVIPQIHEQRKIAAILSTVDAALQTTQQIIEATISLKRGLMQQLLTQGINNQNFKKTELGIIPKDWKIVRLDSLYSEETKNGIYKSHKFYGAGTQIIRIDGYDLSGKFVNSDFSRVKLEENEKSDFALKKNDLLINRVNSLSHVGKVAIIQDLNELTVFESNMIRLRVDKEKILPLYAFYYLLSNLGRKQLKRRVKKAVAQVSINQKDIAAVKILLPNISEQLRIVDVFINIEQKLILEEEYRDQLNLLKTGLMQQLLTGQKRVKISKN